MVSFRFHVTSRLGCFQNDINYDKEMLTKQLLMQVCPRIYIIINVLKIQCVAFGILESSSLPVVAYLVCRKQENVLDHLQQ